MKIFVCGLILSLSFFVVNAQPFNKQPFAVKAKVDERIELTSIVARLAEFEEYVHDEFKIYADDVD